MNIKVNLLNKNAKIPEYKTKGAACADLYAVFNDNWGYTYIHPCDTQIIKTGLAVEVPEGYEMQIRARSGLASRGIILSNGVGTIDSDYRGEVGVILTNTSSDVVKISAGERIAQCCLSKVIPMKFEEATLSETERGEGGYGHTGSL